MKKLMAAIFTFITVLMFFSCSNEPEVNSEESENIGIRSEKMSFERFMSLKSEGENQLDLWLLPSLSEQLENYDKKWTKYSVISGCAIKKSYYITLHEDEPNGYTVYNHGFSGYSLVEFRVEKVIDELNGFSLKPGDVITFQQPDYIIFANPEDLYDFVSEKKGMKLKDIYDLYLYSVGEGAWEIIPEEQKEYRRSPVGEMDLPMKVGESYTMVVKGPIKNDYYYAELCQANNEEYTMEAISKKYNVWFDNIWIKVSNEVNALFK